MAAAQLTAWLREGLGAAKPRLDVERARAGTVRRSGVHAPGMSLFPDRPRRPACADSVPCSLSLGDSSAALGRLG